LGCGAKCTFWETKAQPANPTTAQNPVNALRINIIELFQGVARLVSMKKGWNTVAWLPLSYAARWMQQSGYRAPVRTRSAEKVSKMANFLAQFFPNLCRGELRKAPFCGIDITCPPLHFHQFTDSSDKA
jgi:hypothetical protein